MPSVVLSVADLRSALNHLYEPRMLQSSPLIILVQHPQRTTSAAVLREALIEAIESLKPGHNAPAHSPAWRVYEVLHYRYVQQCSQEEVASQLALSIRQLKREQQRALEVLAERLSQRHGVQIALSEPASAGDSIEPRTIESAPVSELRRLEKLGPVRPVDLQGVISAVRDLIQPIARRYSARVEIELAEPSVTLPVNPVLLRQVLLSILCVVIRCAAGGKVTLAAVTGPARTQLLVTGIGAGAGQELTPEDRANLDIARRLADGCGANLIWERRDGEARAILSLPSPVAVLVIDDNPDAVRLFQRYAAGTRYLVQGTHNPDEGLALACQWQPQVIVLDVMMPEVDGWELLGRLRQHPATSGIPVLACTILPQEELAFSLGVSAFIRKPVTRADFIAALDRLLA
ncbi:MAG: response regulator [Anaerolineae bacterium]|nr:response regulator [Anaerolineae bacterium]